MIPTKAYIKADPDGNGLWMMIDVSDATAWPILKEEVGPIRDACNKWLKENK
jgi:hypothetical protein